MTVSSLLQENGVLVTKQVETVTTTATGSSTKSFANSGSAFRAFVQPQSAGDTIQAGQNTMVITHKVYCPPEQGLESAARLLVVDGSNTLTLDIIGVHRPGLYRSGALALVVVDCQQDTGLDA